MAQSETFRIVEPTPTVDGEVHSADIAAIEQVAGCRLANVLDEKVEIFRNNCGQNMCGLVVNIDYVEGTIDQDDFRETAVDLNAICPRNDCKGTEVKALIEHLEELPGRAAQAIEVASAREQAINEEAGSRANAILTAAQELAEQVRVAADAGIRVIMEPRQEEATAIAARAVTDTAAMRKEVFSEALSSDMPFVPTPSPESGK